MQFNALPYFYLLALVPALAALYLYAFWRKRRALDLFIDPASVLWRTFYGRNSCNC